MLYHEGPMLQLLHIKLKVNKIFFIKMATLLLIDTRHKIQISFSSTSFI